jgi:Helix-turn-helix domain
MAAYRSKTRRPKRGQRVLVNGRSEESAHHVRLYGRHMGSPAWRSLSPVARCLYVELKLLYVGTNNGRLFLSVRMAAERINVSKTTAGLAFKELEDRGFIRLAKPSSFNMKAAARRGDAACWLLTEYPEGDRAGAGSLDFMRWRPVKPVKNGLENHSTVRIADELSHEADRQQQTTAESP